MQVNFPSFPSKKAFKVMLLTSIKAIAKPSHIV